MTYKRIYTNEYSKSINVSQDLNSQIIGLRTELQDLHDMFSGTDIDIDDLHNMLSVFDNNIIPEIRGPEGPEGPEGTQGEIGPQGPIGDNIELFFSSTDRIISAFSPIIFDSNFLTNFVYTNDEYTYNGESGIFKISLNIRYSSVSSNPYEIVECAIIINGIQKFKRLYGYDMQGRIKDDFITNIDSGDTIQILILNVKNTTSDQIKILRDSFAIFKALNIHII